MTSSIFPEPRDRTRHRWPGQLLVSLDRRPANKSRAGLIEGVEAQIWIEDFILGLPPFQGSPIRLEFRPELTAHRGKLLSGDSNSGRAVYAGSFLRERRIVLEEELVSEPRDLRLIFAHEIYHFAWWRLGSNRRAEYDSLLRAELAASARGELGESSSVAKREHVSRECPNGGNSWKQYVCESFCDTGAWLFSGVDELRNFQLAAKWRIKRASWFRSLPQMKV